MCYSQIMQNLRSLSNHYNTKFRGKSFSKLFRVIYSPIRCCRNYVISVQQIWIWKNIYISVKKLLEIENQNFGMLCDFDFGTNFDSGPFPMIVHYQEPLKMHCPCPRCFKNIFRNLSVFIIRADITFNKKIHKKFVTKLIFCPVDMCQNIWNSRIVVYH